MKAKWLGDSDPLELINGKVYDVISKEWNDEFFEVVDETGEAFLYPAEDFEIVSGSPDEYVDEFAEK